MNIILIIFVELFFSVLLGYLGKDRKFGFWGYFFASLLLTPLVGLLLVISSDPPLPDKKRRPDRAT